jgi:hypothetical protein
MAQEARSRITRGRYGAVLTLTREPAHTVRLNGEQRSLAMAIFATLAALQYSLANLK